jgi:hypothetical protein
MDVNSLSETFNKYESQLKSLFLRATSLNSNNAVSSSRRSELKSKIKPLTSLSSPLLLSLPPDEANFALGQQIARIYTNMYFQCCLIQEGQGDRNRGRGRGGGSGSNYAKNKKNVPTTNTTPTNDNHHLDKFKSKWKQIGFTFIANSCRTDGVSSSSSSGFGAHDSLISTFLNVFSTWAIHLIRKMNKDDQNHSDSDILLVIDDFCYWYVSVITNCQQQQQHQYNNITLSSSIIRSYTHFATSIYTLHAGLSDYHHNHEQNSLPLSSSTIASYADKVHTTGTYTRKQLTTREYDDHVQLVRIDHKLQQHQHQRQYYIRQIITHIFRPITTSILNHDHYADTSNSDGTMLLCNLDIITPLLIKLIKSITATSTASDDRYSLSITHDARNVSLLLTNILCESSTLIVELQQFHTNDIDVTQQEQQEQTVIVWKRLLPWLIDMFIFQLPILLRGGEINNKTQQTTTNNLLLTSFVNINDLQCHLLDLLSMIVQREDDRNNNKKANNALGIIVVDNVEKSNMAQHCVNHIFCRVFDSIMESSSSPCIISSLGSSVYQPLLTRLNNLLKRCKKCTTLDLFVSNETLYKAILSTLVLNDENDITLQLETLTTILTSRENDDISYPRLLWNSMYCVGHICLTTNVQKSTLLIQLAVEHLEESDDTAEMDSNGLITMDNIFIKPSNLKQKVDLLKALTSDSKTISASSCSSSKQCTNLLLGLSVLVHFSGHSGGNILALNECYTFLDSILQESPHLGRRCLPILKVILKSQIEMKKGNEVQRLLKFICTSLARDPSCAHAVWTMVSSFIDPSVASIRLQSMILRLYPILCSSNKRLYGRIIESIGTYVSHPNAQLRVVAASSICDLALNDVVRDVSDVIGWIQTFLSDEEPMIVYYAILSLHYLVISNELDYVIVLKVLNKKLVKFHDNIDEILALPDDILIEAIVKFLGNGEADDDDDSSSESDDEDRYNKSVPVHINLSITTLCLLALSDDYLPAALNSQIVEGKPLVLKEMYISLSHYSVENFGIDEDLICLNNYDESNRYYQLKRVVSGGEQLSSTLFSGDASFLVAIEELKLKIEEIEHQSPVSSRWIQQHSQV